MGRKVKMVYLDVRTLFLPYLTVGSPFVVSWRGSSCETATLTRARAGQPHFIFSRYPLSPHTHPVDVNIPSLALDVL